MSTQKYREMLLVLLCQVAKIETNEELYLTTDENFYLITNENFYLIYETDPDDVYDFLHTGLLPANWLNVFSAYANQTANESSRPKRYAMLAFLLGRMYDDGRDLSKIDMDHFGKSVLWDPRQQTSSENNTSEDDNSSPAPPKKRKKRDRPKKVKITDNLDEIARKIFTQAFSKTLSENSIKMSTLNNIISGMLADHSVEFDPDKRKISLYDGENLFVVDHKVPDDISVSCT